MSDNGRCMTFASFHGARIRTPRSSSVVNMTGMAFGRMGSTTALTRLTGAAPSRSKRGQDRRDDDEDRSYLPELLGAFGHGPLPPRRRPLRCLRLKHPDQGLRRHCRLRWFAGTAARRPLIGGDYSELVAHFREELARPWRRPAGAPRTWAHPRRAVLAKFRDGQIIKNIFDCSRRLYRRQAEGTPCAHVAADDAVQTESHMQEVVQTYLLI